MIWGAEVIDYNAEDPIEAIRELTGGIGVDRVIEAVGVDANAPDSDQQPKKHDKKLNNFSSSYNKLPLKRIPKMAIGILVMLLLKH